MFLASHLCAEESWTSHIWAGHKADAVICQTAHLLYVFKKSNIVWEHEEGIIVGVCFWFFMETWYWFALRAGLDSFSVTVLMPHNYSVLKCLCLVFTRSETVQSETHDWVLCPGVEATVSEQWKFQTKTQNEQTIMTWRYPKTYHMFVFRFQHIDWLLFPTSNSGTVSAVLKKMLKCKLQGVNINSIDLNFLQVPYVWLMETVWRGRYFLASWKGCWPFEQTNWH